MTTRQRILAHLKKSRVSTVREMERTLHLSAPNLRHHLRVLASDGRVTIVRTHSEGRGRPENIYSLSDAFAGDNLAGLLDALLSVEGQRLNAEGLAGYLLDANQFVNLPIPRRLALLVEKLNAMHYQARWEAGAEGPRVLFGRCPYAAVIANHPELCGMDAKLVENGLGKEVRQLGKIEQGRGVCIFATR